MTTEPETIELPPIKVALIIDNTVVDILHTDRRLADIFLSNGVLVDITSVNEDIRSGWIYNSETGQFSEPELEA
jgi:hypothetical protein